MLRWKQSHLGPFRPLTRGSHLLTICWPWSRPPLLRPPLSSTYPVDSGVVGGRMYECWMAHSLGPLHVAILGPVEAPLHQISRTRILNSLIIVSYLCRGRRRERREGADERCSDEVD